MSPLRFPRLALALVALAIASSGLAEGQSAKLVEEFIEPAPRDPEVHASTLVEASPGVFVAAWFAGSKEDGDDVTIWSARRTASGWAPAAEVACGSDAQGGPLPCYNPVLFHGEGARLALVYSVGREKSPWLPYVKWSDDRGVSWSAAARLPEGMRGPDRNKPLLLASGELLHPSTGGGRGPTVHVEFSDRALRSWRRQPVVADPHHYEAIQPTLLDHGDGRVQMLCRTYTRELATSWSVDSGKTWSPLEGLRLTLANSAIDAVRLSDGRFALIYNPTGKPKSATDWGPRVPLSVAVSADGRTWKPVLDLETAPIREGYAYPCALVGSDGRLHVTYTWGRKRIRYVVIDPARL